MNESIKYLHIKHEERSTSCVYSSLYILKQFDHAIVLYTLECKMGIGPISDGNVE